MKKINLMYLVLLSVMILVSCPYTASEGNSLSSNGVIDGGGSGDEDGLPEICSETFNPKNKAQLVTNIVTLYLQCGGNSASYSNIDVSAVTDMSYLFKTNTLFNGDISGWDMSGVDNVDSMFEGATAFNQDLSGWELKEGAVKKVNDYFPTKMFYMSGMKPGNLPESNFYVYTPLVKGELEGILANIRNRDNADLSIIDTRQVTDMSSLFLKKTAFNSYLSTWVMSGVENVHHMFDGATNFNQDLSGWKLKVGAVVSNSSEPTKMFYLSGIQYGNLPENYFQYTPTTKSELITIITNEMAKQSDGTDPTGGDRADLSIIDTSQVTNMSELFADNNKFNGYITPWDTSKVMNFDKMFLNATVFNRNLTSWDGTSVQMKTDMFKGATAMEQKNKASWMP